MSRPIVSIVMPVYNTKQLYIETAVNSVLAQSHSNIELIIINDGSTIKSIDALCRKFARRDKRITLIEQDNSGVSMARNRGIMMAKGDYVMFVDADDVVGFYCIERMLRSALEHSADLVLAKHANGTGNVHEDAFSTGFTVKDTTNEQALIDLLSNKIPTGPFAKLINAKLVKRTLFHSEYHIAEDLEFNFRVFQKARRICVSDQVVYWYRESENSAMRSRFNIAKRMSGLSAAQKVLDTARLTSSLYIQRIATYRLMMEAIFILSDTPKGDQYEVVRKRCIAIIRRYRMQVFLTKNVLITNRIIILATFIDIQLGIKLFSIKKRIAQKARVYRVGLALYNQESSILRRLKK